MSDDQFWKFVHKKMLKTKESSPNENELSLQNADAALFEIFGLQLRKKSEAWDNDWTPPISNEEVHHFNDYNVDNVLEMNLRKSDGIHVGNNFVAKITGLNVEDLYEEVIFDIWNAIGCESDFTSETLFYFLQNVFKISEENHKKVLTLVKQKKPPTLRLNVEIVKGENLPAKDANGLSDPFVTLYLNSSPTHRYNSSVKTATLCPSWKEHFSLPITEDAEHDKLIIEVWDFDAAETIQEKVNKIFVVKGIRGLQKLMKEIAITASTGSHRNELIGKASVSLKSIPTSGVTEWYNLEKGSHRKNKGTILLNLALGAEKNKKVAIQEHQHLLKLLLLHELEELQVDPFQWSGFLYPEAEVIRSQHSVHSGLSSFDCALCEWVVYISIHQDYPLSFSLFSGILNILVPAVKGLYKNSDDLRIFWEGVRTILPSCFSIIRKLRFKHVGDKQILVLLCEVLDILSAVDSITPPSELDLFPKNLYGWLLGNDNVRCNISKTLNDAVLAGTKEWLEEILTNQSNITERTAPDDIKIQTLIKTVQMVRSDIERAMEYYDKLFYQKMGINLSAILFRYYDRRISEFIESTVKDVCVNLKPLESRDDVIESASNIYITALGTKLFELFLVLQQFSNLGKELCSGDQLILANFYTWFMPGVTVWLDISLMKTLTRVKKAIDLDTLQVVDTTVQYSSSAIDTLAIFYQVKIFWEQLDWPDVESSYTYLARIVNDICRCCTFYAQKLSCGLGNNSNDDGWNILKWCVIINNIDFLQQSLPSLIEELGTGSVLKKLADFHSALEADRCAATIKAVVDNALDTQQNQKIELIEVVAKEVAKSLRQLLAEGAEVIHTNSNAMGKMMLFLENSLQILSDALNEINFQRTLDAIWSEMSVVLHHLVQENLDKRRPPEFFQNLRKTLFEVIAHLRTESLEASNDHILADIMRILDLQSLDTGSLIHQHYFQQTEEKLQTEKSNYGQLTIKANFTTSYLKLTIMNARNLVPVDRNSTCSPFVKVSFLPFDRFLGISQIKTATYSNTCFPLIDETFAINMTEEQLSSEDGLILFHIKERDLFGIRNRTIAECCLKFAEVKQNVNEQIHMTLRKPEYRESDIIKVLEQRQGDKQAVKFLKKLKS